MNERIQELFEQALEEFNAGPVFAAYIIPDPIKEKFAQLIVQECAKVLHTEMYRLDTLPGREVSAQTMETAAALLKKHFGVEE